VSCFSREKTLQEFEQYVQNGFNAGHSIFSQTFPTLPIVLNLQHSSTEGLKYASLVAELPS
jgi:hypothetical protein